MFGSGIHMAQNSRPFTITLPTEAIEMIEGGLIPFGLYGKKRATLCGALILDMLKTPAVQDQIQRGRDRANKA